MTRMSVMQSPVPVLFKETLNGPINGFTLLMTRHLCRIMSAVREACHASKSKMEKKYGCENCPLPFDSVTPSLQSRAELESAERSFFKFMLVRDPFERLHSCYRDKMVDNPHWSLVKFRKVVKDRSV